MENNNESFLLKKLKEGDINALETIFNAHYSKLCLYLLLLFKNQLLVENIAQDIFIYIWENREKLEIKTSLESYLYSAGRYKAINQIRNAKRQQMIKEHLGNDYGEAEISSHTILERKELERIIEEAISTLPNRCQQIFRLSREDDMSYKAISELLNISVNTVEGQMVIALKKLRGVLKPFYLGMFLSL